MRRFIVLSSLLFSSACAAIGQDEPAASGMEVATGEEGLSSADRVALRALRTALVGHTSEGSEGDPTPYKAVLLPATLTGALSKNKVAAAAGPLIPELRDVRKAGGGTYAAETGKSMDAYWRNELARAEGSSVEQNRVVNLMNTVNANMRDVRNLVVGVRRQDSIDNGAVAPMVVGKLPSGRAVALYGIDIWT